MHIYTSVHVQTHSSTQFEFFFLDENFSLSALYGQVVQDTKNRLLEMDSPESVECI